MSDADEPRWDDYITFHKGHKYPPTIIQMMAQIGTAIEEVAGKGRAIVEMDYSGIVLKVRETDEAMAERIENALKSAQNNEKWRAEALAKKEKAAAALGVTIEEYEEAIK